MTQPLKIAVMGAGAVGCYFGGMLARAGHEVVLIARPQHVAAVQHDGLRMETKTFDERVRLAASSEQARCRARTWSCSASNPPTPNPPALKCCRTWPPDALVLTPAERRGQRRPPARRATQAQVAAAVVYVATEMAGPGHVKHHGRGELVIEPSGASERRPQALIAAGVPTEISDNVRGALWAKLILNCAYNAVSAIAQLPYGKAVQGEGVRDVMRDVVAECLAVAKAEGVARARRRAGRRGQARRRHARASMHPPPRTWRAASAPKSTT